MVYHKLPENITNPGPVLDVLRTCRKAMLEEGLKVKPMGTAYHGLHMVVAAIDAFAMLMIRRPDYFLGTGAEKSDASRDRERIEHEADVGSRLWKD